MNEKRAINKAGSNQSKPWIYLYQKGNKHYANRKCSPGGLGDSIALDPGSGPDDGLQEYTRYTVVIRRGNRIYTYNDKGSFVSAVVIATAEDSPLRIIRNKMRQYTIGEKTYWMGNHKEQGIVLYDPATQVDVAGSQLRLFAANTKRMGLYSMDVRDILEDPHRLKELETEVIKAIRFYHDLRARARSTHCYSCKKPLNSVDFSVCGRCGWIKCVCDACGCGYQGCL